MNWSARLHFLHRAWRYRLRSEKFGVSFLLSRDLTGKTAVDIGANWGIYSYGMHGHVGAEGHVIAFEPGRQHPEAEPKLGKEKGLLRSDPVVFQPTGSKVES